MVYKVKKLVYKCSPSMLDQDIICNLFKQELKQGTKIAEYISICQNAHQDRSISISEERESSLSQQITNTKRHLVQQKFDNIGGDKSF